MKVKQKLGKCKDCGGNIFMEGTEYGCLFGSVAKVRFWCDGSCGMEVTSAGGDILGIGF